MTGDSPRLDDLSEVIDAMNSTITHRGPDDCGTWIAPNAGVGFGFRRLSILDLSPAGHQPMVSASGRFVIVFNGEVYNYLEIGEELRQSGARFRGHSDTEVILAAFERWGIERSVQRFIGMFAMAVWDSETRCLSLVRDRLGIKPLFYYHRPGILTFGSELKALAAGPHFDRTVDDTALTAYLRYLFVPAPLTIYKHVKKLLPGHILTAGTLDQELPEPVPYWSLRDAYAAGRANPFDGSDAEVVAELRRLLSDAVRLRMRSDVPMGALLSGGIDSSTVVALMQENASRPTRTFSIGFPGTAHDEARHAAGIAAVLGTDHRELSVSGADALNVVPLLPEMFDEPFADPSQIPTYLVCKLAREEVTVALSGDGGDEGFAGYQRYVGGERVIARAARVPRALRAMAGKGIQSATSSFWDRVYTGLAPIVDRRGRHRLAGEKIRKLGALLEQPAPNAMYNALLSSGWQDPGLVLRRPGAARPRVEALLGAYDSLPLLDRMMLVDQETYLADDLLAKVDRASMAVSLEARVPLLDHRVIEFGWRLDRRHKIREARGKWALRHVLYGLVDRELVDRPKTGFSVPLADWLRGPLRGWAGDLLFGTGGSSDEWIDTRGVTSAWERLHRGGAESALGLWAVLMFQAWRGRWLP